MGNAKFYLKTPNAEKSPIICLYSFNARRVKLYTGITINVKQWDKEQQISKTKGYRDGGRLNKELADFAEKLQVYMEYCREHGYAPTDTDLKDCIKPQMEAPKKLTFWGAWNTYIKKKGESLPMKLKLRAIEGRLKSYEKANHDLTFESLDINIMEAIEYHFIYKEKLQNSTVAKHLSFFKSFLHWSVNNDITDNIKWQRFKVSNPPDKLKVVLSTSEIQMLKAYDVGEKLYLANARDLFLIGIYTGLRFSDFTKIQSQHLKINDAGEPSLVMRQQKTSEMVEIPLTDEAYTLCKKVVSKETRVISNQNLNNYLKELCELAGIDEPFETFEFRGNKKISKTVPKWKLIGTHTARRTFATNLLLQGLPSQVVMEYTGHADIKSFQKYVNVPKNSQNSLIRKAITNYAG